MFLLFKKAYSKLRIIGACSFSGFGERCHGMPSVAQRPDLISFNGGAAGDLRSYGNLWHDFRKVSMKTRNMKNS